MLGGLNRRFNTGVLERVANGDHTGELGESNADLGGHEVTGNEADG